MPNIAQALAIEESLKEVINSVDVPFREAKKLLARYMRSVKHADAPLFEKLKEEMEKPESMATLLSYSALCMTLGSLAENLARDEHFIQSAWHLFPSHVYEKGPDTLVAGMIHYSFDVSTEDNNGNEVFLRRKMMLEDMFTV